MCIYIYIYQKHVQCISLKLVFVEICEHNASIERNKRSTSKNKQKTGNLFDFLSVMLLYIFELGKQTCLGNYIV